MMQVPRYWREQAERYNLMGTECGNCGHRTFPRRTLCPSCRHLSKGKLKDVRFEGRATLETWTVVHQAPDSHALETPYILGLVRLTDGPRLTTQIVEVPVAALAPGLELEARFRKLGESGGSGVLHYGYKFGPVR